MTHSKQTIDKPVRYLVLFLLIAQSSIPFFFGDTHLVIAIGITAFIFVIRQIKFDKILLSLLLIFSILMLVQAALFSLFEFKIFLGVIARITYAYMAVKIIGPDFARYFVQLLYAFTLLALFLWVVIGFVPGAYQAAHSLSDLVIPFELYQHERDNIILYTNDYWMLTSPPRNAGPFWEPGGFGVFLVLSLALNTLITQELFNKKNLIFFIAAITTFSFGTYLSLFVFVILYLVLVKRIVKGYAFPLLAIVISVSAYSYFEFDFLQQKLIKREKKTELLLKPSDSYSSITKVVGRNAQARLDLRDFYKSPIVGTGLFQNYEFSANASGLTSLLRLWGIAGTLTMFITMYFSFRRYCQFRKISLAYALLATLTLILIAISQSLYGKPLFLGLIFVFLVNFKIDKGSNELNYKRNPNSF